MAGAEAQKHTAVRVARSLSEHVVRLLRQPQLVLLPHRQKLRPRRSVR